MVKFVPVEIRLGTIHFNSLHKFIRGAVWILPLLYVIHRVHNLFNPTGLKDRKKERVEKREERY